MRPVRPRRPINRSCPLPSLAKEAKLYSQESEEQKTKLDAAVAENADEWTIKNAVSRTHGFPPHAHAPDVVVN